MMPKLCKAAAIILCLLPAALAAQEKDCGKPADLADGWRVAAPAEHGLDPALICAIGPRFDAWKDANAHAVVVIHKGALVYERYFTGEDEKLGRPLGAVKFDAATKHDLRSISKSVTALVVGIAVDRGWIKDIDAPVFSYFPEYAAPPPLLPEGEGRYRFNIFSIHAIRVRSGQERRQQGQARDRPSKRRRRCGTIHTTSRCRPCDLRSGVTW
jgi:CubicO group peptidase (beta-lactamase class C family)